MTSADFSRLEFEQFLQDFSRLFRVTPPAVRIVNLYHPGLRDQAVAPDPKRNQIFVREGFFEDWPGSRWGAQTTPFFALAELWAKRFGRLESELVPIMDAVLRRLYRPRDLALSA